MKDSKLIIISTKSGRGKSVLSEHPADVCKALYKGGAEVAKNLPAIKPELPKGPFELIIKYSEPAAAIRNCNYPGAVLVDDFTVKYVSENYLDIMRAIIFIG
ncbi:MAG: hypothetical protein GXZ11_08790 [Tissierellia bacterium]|nr:hypothetical protein [Tissierellia bacterium]